MKKQKPMSILFSIYCALVLWLLFDRATPDTKAAGFSYWQWIRNNTSLQPLHTIRLFWNVLACPQGYIDRMGLSWYEANRQHAIINLVGNIVMFLPAGFFPPQIKRSFQKLWKTLLTAAIMIMAMEILQVLTLRGNCDIDDLLLNLLGTAIGYGIYKLSPHKSSM